MCVCVIEREREWGEGERKFTHKKMGKREEYSIRECVVWWGEKGGGGVGERENSPTEMGKREEYSIRESVCVIEREFTHRNGEERGI